jgi:hypothetical protein
MQGRTCLLALLFVIVSWGVLPGQSDRAEPLPDFPIATLRPTEPSQPVRPSPPPPTPRFGLPELAKAAGMIFSGTVTQISRRPAASDAFPTVAITFHVDSAIRGATSGEDQTIKQWIGLWSSGQRYHVGDRALFFLYPPSKLGLTSCVGWPLGRFAMDHSGHVLLSAQQLSSFRQDPVLGGRSRVSFRDFARAVQLASGQEWQGKR